MGNKIITEKDFWMCSMGNVPAQMQGTRKGTKKASGEIYITVEDTSTSSWIDFGCKKLMLLMALAAAAAVVALAVIGVLTVATGGAALIALGAVAGLVGAAIGAVAGGLMCGQKIASKREWSGSKSNFISQGSATITGDHTMVCAAGGTVSFAPQIKNWGQAIALGSANYIGGLMEGMMAGAAVGMGGAALSGGASALAGGGIRGLGQVSLNFVKSMPRNFAVNAIESVSKVGLALRGVMGVQNTAATYGETGTADIGDFGEGVIAMETGAYESAGNILSGQGTWQDYVGMAMMVAPVGQGKRDLLDQKNKPTEDGGAGNKADDADAKKTDEDAAIRAKDTDAENAKKDGEHDAYEDPAPPKTPQQHYDDISQYRRNNDLPEYKLDDGSTGTAAKVEINSQDYYGLNSKLSPESKALRQKWFENIEWVPPKSKQPAHLGHAQSLTHAEAHSLMKAYEDLGSLPKEVDLYVDRPTCNMCKGELPALMREMGIEKLNIFSGGSNTPTTIFPPG